MNFKYNFIFLFIGSHKSSSPSPDYWSKHQNGGELDSSSHEKSPYVGNVSTRSTSESASSHRSAVSGGGGSSVTSLKLTRLGRFFLFNFNKEKFFYFQPSQ